MQMIYLFQGSRPLLCSLHLKITIKHLFMTLCQNMIMMYTSGFNLWSAIHSVIHIYSSVLLALLHVSQPRTTRAKLAARFTWRPSRAGFQMWQKFNLLNFSALNLGLGASRRWCNSTSSLCISVRYILMYLDVSWV